MHQCEGAGWLETYFHGKHPAGGLAQRVSHGQIQALQVVVLDDEGEHGPLGVTFALAERTVGGDESRELGGGVSEQRGSQLWQGGVWGVERHRCYMELTICPLTESH